MYSAYWNNTFTTHFFKFHYWNLIFNVTVHSRVKTLYHTQLYFNNAEGDNNKYSIEYTMYIHFFYNNLISPSPGELANLINSRIDIIAFRLARGFCFKYIISRSSNVWEAWICAEREPSTDGQVVARGSRAGSLWVQN